MIAATSFDEKHNILQETSKAIDFKSLTLNSLDISQIM